MTGWFAAERPAAKILAQLGSHVVSRAILLISTIAIARTVGVANYGVFALALVFYQAGLLLRDAGLGQALIILGGADGQTSRRAFVLGSAVGIAFAAVIAAASDPVTTALGLPAAAPLLQVLALAFAIGSLGIASNAALERDLRFAARAAIDISSYVALAAITALGLNLGWGALSLAWGYVGQGAVQAGLAVVVQPPWRRTNDAEGVPFRSFARYGSLLWASAFLSYVATNLDNLAVAALGGATAIGVYALSYTLGTTITISLAQVLNRVALPYYARAADHQARQATFRSVAPLSMALGIFAGAPVIALAPEARDLILGSTAPVAPLAILAAYGVLRAVGIAIGTSLNGSGRAMTATVAAVVNVGLIVLLVVPAYRIAGIVGVAAVDFLSLFASVVLLRNSIRQEGGSLAFLGLPMLGLALLVALAIDPGGPAPLHLRLAAGTSAMVLAAIWAWRIVHGGGFRFDFRAGRT